MLDKRNHNKIIETTRNDVSITINENEIKQIEINLSKKVTSLGSIERH